ncbi:MAG TPA: hypothetical protein VG225_00320 [Terracidiphilus sp.]|nr:hypothetical protein [Terracidiphilus sp.]
MHAGSEYLYLPLLVLAFLIIDLLVEVDSPRALLLNPFFWLYWLVYSVAAGAALYFMTNGMHPAIARLPMPALVLVAIVGTTTILQSLTFKVGGKRVLDLSRYLDDYRRKVLTSSASLVIRQQKRRVLRQSNRILRKIGYQGGHPESDDRMRAMYAEVMLFGARKPETVQREIAKIMADCQTAGANFGEVVARRVAQADPEWVKSFLAGS